LIIFIHLFYTPSFPFYFAFFSLLKKRRKEKQMFYNLLLFFARIICFDQPDPAMWDEPFEFRYGCLLLGIPVDQALVVSFFFNCKILYIVLHHPTKKAKNQKEKENL
jgi:hypothetical protein